MYTILKKPIYIGISIIILFLSCSDLKAEQIDKDQLLSLYNEVDTIHVERAKWKTKLTAVGLAIILGPFGVHRLYLGTSTFVPVAYTLTLGGGLGILPVLDIVTIIFTKDMEKITNHKGMFLFLPK